MIEAGEPIDQKWLDAGTWEVEIANTRTRRVASLKPLFRSREQEGQRLSALRLPGGPFTRVA